MSYNIIRWKTKRLENLIIPLSAFFESERSDWHPETQMIEEGKIILNCGCEQTIKGEMIENENIFITEILMSGEGSGTFMYHVFLNALKKSIGELEAILIWEGGDSVTKLIVKNGVVRELEVEL